MAASSEAQHKAARSYSEASLCLTFDSALNCKQLGFHTLVFSENERESFQMMADHGDPCGAQEATYCMNGGTCYRINSMNTLSCVCHDHYKGSRCEQFQLFSSSANSGEAGIIAAIVITVLLIVAVLAVVVYYTCKVLKAKQQSQQSSPQPYWKVRPRV